MAQKAADGVDPPLRWRDVPMPINAPMISRMTSLTPILT